MHRTHKRLQISSETLRTLRGRELGMVGGVDTVQLSFVKKDCCSDLQVPPLTQYPDCKITDP